MTNQDTAVAVIEQSADAGIVEWNLDAFPEGEFNRLLPTQTIQMPTDLLRPVVQVVKLSPNPDDGDVYHSDDMPAGHSAPTKVGLRKLMTAAGISIVDERRTDDGTNPDVIEVTALGEMLLPTGQRITAPGMKRIDLAAKKWKSDAHKGKFKSFFLENVASGAENRAIRALTSLRGSYPTQVFNRPFAVVSYAPNMNHPEIRARYLDSFAPAAAQLYGGKAAPKQIGAGPAEIRAAEAPEEDPAPTPTQLPGEKLAAATSSSEEPEWMRESAPAAKPAKQPTFAEAIRAQAGEGDDAEELATADDLAPLREIFAGWGGVVAAGIHALFDSGDGPQDPSRLSKGQARAIALVHESLGHAKFETSWRSTVDAATKAAA